MRRLTTLTTTLSDYSQTQQTIAKSSSKHETPAGSRQLTHQRDPLPTTSHPPATRRRRSTLRACTALRGHAANSTAVAQAPPRSLGSLCEPYRSLGRSQPSNPHHRTTAPPHHRTTAPPRHRTTAPPHHRTTAPSHHRTEKSPRNRRALGPWACRNRRRSAPHQIENGIGGLVIFVDACNVDAVENGLVVVTHVAQ